jgi:uncharacterized protein (TIGR03086 family)
MHTDNLAALDATAVRDTVRLVATVTPDDLGRPTPCAGWDLGALLAHMTVQHRGFAAAAQGNGSDLAVWQSPATTPHPVRAYAAAAELVRAAFASPGVLDRAFVLPELGRTVPGRTGIGFHLVDYVVHGWDVARTLGLPFTPEAPLAAAALEIARAVPTGAVRLAPGAAFAPALNVPVNADPLTETLLLLGRDPSPPA